MRRPPIIKVKEVLSSKQDPLWNYSKILTLSTNKVTLEPCCLKSKPCWECS